MELKSHLSSELSADLIDAIRSLPLRREVEHCGAHFDVSPFDMYAVCPECGTRLKVRALSGTIEIEDVFEAVLEWMTTPAGLEAATRRLGEIAADADE